MSVLHEERQLSAEQRRALKLLADAGEQGCTGPNLFNLVSHGLATGTSRNRESGLPKEIKVARIRITDACRRALEG
jgi:hypothetical protein